MQFHSSTPMILQLEGPPIEIWSDSETTFHVTDAILRAMMREAEIQWDVVAGTLADEGIIWRFIPPSAPHFGGLWEAAVKSAKSHLQRVIGEHVLTFEELSTLLAQIEFCLNSRPLTPHSGDLSDPQALTPWLLLTGFMSQQIPEPSIFDGNLDHLTHWHLVQGMRDHFWCCWTKEYLNTLQQRAKWVRPTSNLQVNDLDLIVDPSLFRHGRWPMGRITQVHPGHDGRVRVATI